MPHAASDVYLGCQCDVFGWGGALSSALGLAHALAEAELSPLLLGTASGATTPAGSVRGVRRMNLTIRSTGAAWRVANWVRAGRIARALHVLPAPRVAFVANSPFWALAARRVWPRVRLIYRFPCMLSHCLPFTWPPNRPRSAWERVDFAGLRRAERAALERSDLIWAATQANVDEICAFAPRAAAKVQRIRFGHRALKLDPQRRETVRSEHGFDEDSRVLLTGGVLDRNKAVEYAIDALAELPDSYSLVIVGDGDRRGALQAHACRRGVAERTHFVGVQRDISPWLSAADVVLSTSHYDAFPNLIREALAAGAPVVLPRHDPPRVYSGLADLLAERGAGLTYEHGDARALASAIVELADPTVVEQCVRAGQAVAQREFRWDDCVRELVAARG